MNEQRRNGVGKNVKMEASDDAMDTNDADVGRPAPPPFDVRRLCSQAIDVMMERNNGASFLHDYRLIKNFHLSIDAELALATDRFKSDLGAYSVAEVLRSAQNYREIAQLDIATVPLL